MRIAIFGCGGVGAYFGGRLAQIGQDVSFIARNENLEALRDRGLIVDSIAGLIRASGTEVRVEAFSDNARDPAAAGPTTGKRPRPRQRR